MPKREREEKKRMEKIYHAYLEVTVLSAEGLRFSGGNSAFVTVCVGSDNVKSTYLDTAGGSSPHWNQALQLPLPAAAVVPPSFTVKVRRKSAFRIITVAAVTVPISDVAVASCVPVRRLVCYRLRDLRKEPNGIINLAVKLVAPVDSVARWMAPLPVPDRTPRMEMELSNLFMNQKRMKKMEITGLSAEDLRVQHVVPRNVYVIVRTGRAAAKSTSIVRNGGSHPCWDDRLQIPLPATGWHSFLVEVRYRSAFGDREIGAAAVPMSDIVADYVPAHLVHFLSYRLWDRSGERNGIINLAVKIMGRGTAKSLGQ